MTEKESTTNSKKAEKLNSDIYSEDLKLLNQTVAEKTLLSRKEGLHAWANVYRGFSVAEKEQLCQYRFGGFCTNEPQPQKKLRKTTDEYCQACLQAQKNKALQDAGAQAQQELFDICGVSQKYRIDPFYKWAEISDFIDNLTNEMEELKKPVESYLAEINRLEMKLKELNSAKHATETENITLKQKIETSKQETLKVELQKRISLETDYARLKEQFEKLKREPAYQQNVWLTRELQQANQQIEKLKAQNEQQAAIINSLTIQGVAK